MLHLLQDPLEDVDTSVGHVDLGLLVVRRHKVIVTLTGGGRKEGGGERERERERRKSTNLCGSIIVIVNSYDKLLLLTALIFLSMLRGRLNRTLWL